MKITSLILAGLGGTLIGTAALAQQGVAPAAPRAMRADTNNDGAISRAEFLARAEARFARVDADRNGVLTREERRSNRVAMRAERGERRAAMQQRRGTRMLARLDGDRDGRVSLGEFQSGVGQRMAARPLPEGVTAAQRAVRMTARFQRWDGNRDGYVDQAEMQSIQRGGRRGPAREAM